MNHPDRFFLWAVAALASFLAFAGCGDDDDDDAAGDGDADSDGDSDSDGDTDSDADADGDADECESESTDETCSDLADNNGNDYTDCADFCCSGNPDVTVCINEVAVQDLQTDQVENGTVVTLTNMIVTAIQEETSWYMQDAGAEDPANSGIFAFVPDTNPDGITIPAIGDIIDVTGEYQDFHGLAELTFLREPVIVSSGNAFTFVPVSPGDVGNHSGDPGARAEELESVFITTSGTVTEINPPPGTGDDDPNNEFVLDDFLRVDDKMYLAVVALDDFVAVTGVLGFGNDYFRLEPRSADDVQNSGH